MQGRNKCNPGELHSRTTLANCIRRYPLEDLELLEELRQKAAETGKPSESISRALPRCCPPAGMNVQPAALRCPHTPAGNDWLPTQMCGCAVLLCCRRGSAARGCGTAQLAGP